MQKKTTVALTFSGLTISSLITLSAINKAVIQLATSKGLLDSRKKEIYHWRFGDISYSITGEGKPVLLIHDLTEAGSSIEWSEIIPKLSRTNTV